MGRGRKVRGVEDLFRSNIRFHKGELVAMSEVHTQLSARGGNGNLHTWAPLGPRFSVGQRIFLYVRLSSLTHMAGSTAMAKSG
jgi:hypothetical protein